MDFLNLLSQYRTPAGDVFFQGITLLAQEPFVVVVICWLRPLNRLPPQCPAQPDTLFQAVTHRASRLFWEHWDCIQEKSPPGFCARFLFCL